MIILKTLFIWLWETYITLSFAGAVVWIFGWVIFGTPYIHSPKSDFFIYLACLPGVIVNVYRALYDLRVSSDEPNERL